LERGVLGNPAVMPECLSSVPAASVIFIVCMFALSLGVIGQLSVLQIRDFRRNLRLEAARQRLGLKRGHRLSGSRPFRPKFPPAPRTVSAGVGDRTVLSHPWTTATAGSCAAVGSTPVTMTAMAATDAQAAVRIFWTPRRPELRPA
jgi:hypothetical protein